MEYKSVADLKKTTRELAHDLPQDINLIVAIPRSGLLVGNLFCLYTDLPMTNVAGPAAATCSIRATDT